MLNENIISSLRSGFKPECIQIVKEYRDANSGRDVCLLGIKPQYIIERLNDSFGHDGWDFEIQQFELSEKAAWALCKLSIYAVVTQQDSNHPDYPFRRHLITEKQQFGHCNVNKALYGGDALKGAATNALEKAASQLDVGHEAYKGLLERPDTPTDPKEKQFAELKHLCSQYEIGKTTFPALCKHVLKRSVDADKAKDDLNEEDLTRLIEHVKKNKAPF